MNLAVFKNVPEKLEIFVRDHLLDSTAPDRSRLYLQAASAVIAQYLHKNAFESPPDKFLNHSTNNAGDVSYRYPLRIMQIGETLFCLRNEPGFGEFCRRMRGRDLRSSFFELYAAKCLQKGGYEIRARPETLVKRQDFDFEAVNGAEQINVEVTALDEKSTEPKTVANALSTKRKQIPNTAPAIIFVVLSDSMMQIQMNWNKVLKEITDDFFDDVRGTKRVNVVTFIGEFHRELDASGKGAIAFIHQDHINRNARHAIQQDISAVFGKAIKSDVFSAMMQGTPVDADKVIAEAEKHRTSEFFRWVDYLVPKHISQ